MARLIENAATVRQLCQQLDSDNAVAALVSDETVAKQVVAATTPWMFANADSAFASWKQEHEDDRFVFVAMFQFRGRSALAAKFVSRTPGDEDDGWMLAIAPKTATIAENFRFFDGIVKSLGVDGEWQVHHDSSPLN